MMFTGNHVVTFLCSIAPLQSAVQVTGDGNGLRLKIDVPESELNNALPLLAMRNEVLRVTVEVDAVKHYENSNAGELATRSERKPKWTTTKGPDMDGPDRPGGAQKDNAS